MSFLKCKRKNQQKLLKICIYDITFTIYYWYWFM